MVISAATGPATTHPASRRQNLRPASDGKAIRGRDAFFTTPHDDGWPIVLVNLDKIGRDELRELITDS